MTFSPELTAQIMDRIERLATFSEEPDRLTRPFLSPSMLRAVDQVSAWMRGAGMRVRRDTIGNLIGHYPASEPEARRLLLGSHIDTVRDAGKYDGPLGVMLALACVEALHREGRHLPFAIDVIAFAEEEGLRYSSPYMGSKALAGTFDLDLQRTDADGVSVADAIRAAGGDPAQIPQDQLQAKELIAYCEVHIEQGPVLEALHMPIGVVTSIAGQSRIRVQFTGVAGHAGTVPMALRRDALAAAAAFVLAVERTAREQEGLVATVGQLAVQPGASNVIAGDVVLSLDVRHQDNAVRSAACAHLRQLAEQIGAERQIAVHWTLLQQNEAVACDGRLQHCWSRAISDIGYQPHYLVSGAGHDGVAMSTLTPISMLFVRCAGGISHNPAESVQADDVGVAAAALSRFLDILAEEQ